MQNNTKILIGAGSVLILVALGGFYLTRYDHYEGMMGGNYDRQREYDRKDNNDRTMMDDGMGGMDHSNMMGSLSERKFLEEMIPHHQEAVDTATLVVEKGDNAEVKKLAQEIITAQEKEIASMKEWCRNWYGTEYKDTGTYEPMMRKNFSSLSGNALDRAFLEDMIQHHMGALMMGQSVVANIQHKEIEDLAKAIAETQSSEIITMRILLKQI